MFRRDLLKRTIGTEDWTKVVLRFQRRNAFLHSSKLHHLLIANEGRRRAKPFVRCRVDLLICRWLQNGPFFQRGVVRLRDGFTTTRRRMMVVTCTAVLPFFRTAGQKRQDLVFFLFFILLLRRRLLTAARLQFSRAKRRKRVRVRAVFHVKRPMREFAACSWKRNNKEKEHKKREQSSVQTRAKAEKTKETHAPTKSKTFISSLEASSPSPLCPPQE